MRSAGGGGIIDLFGVLYCGSFGISRLPHDCGLRPYAVPAFSVDWFGDSGARLGLVRIRGCGRFGCWLVLVWEPRDSDVLGWMSIVSACRIACFRGLIRESNPEIGFDPSVAAKSAVFLIDRIPKALGFRCFRLDTGVDRLSLVPSSRTEPGIGGRDWIRYVRGVVVGGVAACPSLGIRGIPLFPAGCGGWLVSAVTTTRGLVRKSDLEIGFSPAWELWLVWRLAGHGMGTAGFQCFWVDADCVQSAGLSVSMD